MESASEDNEEASFGFRIDSDNLDLLRPIVDWAADRFGGVERLPRLYLVIDANTVYRELRFRLKEKRKPGARSALDEVLATGLTTVFAPRFLLQEVEKNVEEWAKEMKTTPKRLRDEWFAYQNGLVFCSETPRATRAAEKLAARHPIDLPYVYLQDNLSAEMILTEDHDIRDSGAPTADAAVIFDLRNYARNQSVFVTLTVSSVSGLYAILQGLMALARFIVRSVVSLILTLAAGTLLWMLHRWAKAKAGTSAFQRAWEMFKDAIGRLLRMMKHSYDRATVQWKRVTNVFAGRKRRPLRQFIFAVCARAGGALAVVEIVRQVLSDGYKTRARRFKAQVRRCLRTDGRFLEGPTGWTLAWGVRAA
jgi:hypothetical protein